MGKFKTGKSGNPGGRPRLSPEIIEMRETSLFRAVKILYAKIHDSKYIAKLRPSELTHLLEVAFDRCGLPRVTQNELTGAGVEALSVFTITMGDKTPVNDGGQV